jgi:hypothetical protein
MTFGHCRGGAAALVEALVAMEAGARCSRSYAVRVNLNLNVLNLNFRTRGMLLGCYRCRLMLQMPLDASMRAVQQQTHALSVLYAWLMVWCLAYGMMSG